MNTQTSIESLYNEFQKLVEAGDETAARTFLKDHLSEFPADAQNKILFAFFEESLNKRADIIADNGQLQEQSMDLLKKIETAKTTLTDQKKTDDVRAKMGL
jgi:hypothetical protein